MRFAIVVDCCRNENTNVDVLMCMLLLSFFYLSNVGCLAVSVFFYALLLFTLNDIIGGKRNYFSRSI